jgi:hypothetical protein
MKAERVSGGITPFISKLGVVWRWAVNTTPRPIYIGVTPQPSIAQEPCQFKRLLIFSKPEFGKSKINPFINIANK